MKTNMMRAPLIKSAAVLLVFVLLAYLTSSSPEGGVLNSVGLIIIGAFRLVQWAVAMAIGVAVCIAFLIGIFLFAVSLVNKASAASMYAEVKSTVAALCQPLFPFLRSLQCKESAGAQPSSPAQGPTGDQLKGELQAIIAAEVTKVTDNQQALNDQFAALSSTIQALEEKSAGFAVAGQIDTLAAEINASGKILGTVQETVATLESKLRAATEQLQTLTPDTILGDIPARLEQLEQKGEEQGFDPKPLAESIETLQREMDELKKKGPSNAKTRKKP